jgi:hypothetical protein
MGAGCKPAGFCLRWFESNTLHQPIRQASRRGANLDDSRPAGGSDGRLRRMPSTSLTHSVRERPASRAGSSCEHACAGGVCTDGVCADVRRRRVFSAGVAQLVERQPSKLNVASSNLVSRSVFSGFWAPQPKTFSFLIFGAPTPKIGDRFASRRAGELWASQPKVWRLVRLLRTGCISFCFAHLAQLVEHVLGKDEVTSSILVVGSKRHCV